MKNFEEFFNEKKKEKKFDRVEYYKEYYKNLSPSNFNISVENDTIKIKIKK